MAKETEGASRVRFDRRQVEIPAGGNYAANALPVPRRTPWGAIFFASTTLLLMAALAWGFEQYRQQGETLDFLRERIAAIASRDDGPGVAAYQQTDTGGDADSPALSSTGKAVEDSPALAAMRQEVEETSVALALARQRIAALQAELGLAGTGLTEPSEPGLVDGEVEPEQRIRALELEVRLLQRERDAARRQIDRLMLRGREVDRAVAGGLNPEMMAALQDQLDDLQRERDELAAALAAQTDFAKTAGARADMAEGSLAELEAAHADTERALARIEQAGSNDEAAGEEAEAEIARLRQEVAGITATASRVDERAQRLANENAALERALEASYHGISEAESRAAALQDELDLLRAQQDEADAAEAKDRAALNEARTSLKETLEARNVELEAARSRLVEMQNELAELEGARSSVSLAQTDEQVAERDQAALNAKAEFDELQAENDRLQEALSLSEQQLASADTRLADLEAELAQDQETAVADAEPSGEVRLLRAAVDAGQARIDALLAENSRLRSSLDDRFAEANQAEVAFAEMESLQRRNAVLTAELAALRAELAALEREPASGPDETAAAPDSSGDDIRSELETLRQRQSLLEAELTRLAPEPPRPAPR